jgi:murein DD-endopeptidase MepM/ murein hydrolase activator NlpD
MPYNESFPNLRPVFERKAADPLTPKEGMARGFQNAAASAGLSNLDSAAAGEVAPIEEYDYELKSQELENKATEIRARLQQQRWQNTLSDVRASQQKTYNAQQNYWQNLDYGPKPAPMFRSFKNPSPQFQAFAQAISGQESGGNYGAVNSSSGAMGRYQIMPANIAGPGGWDQQVLGRNITTSKFLHSPKVQDRIALHMLQPMFAKHGVRGAASEWYSGDPNAWRGAHGGSQQENAPSIANYANQILQRYNVNMRRYRNQNRRAQDMALYTGLRGMNDPLKGRGDWQFTGESDYGPRQTGQGFHTGIDLNGAPEGTPVYAAQSGRIAKGTGWDSGYGNQVYVQGRGSTRTSYSHLKNIAKGIKRGDMVHKGQLIGYLGNTGSYSQGAHLHFEAYRKGHTINPMRFFRRLAGHA